MVFKGYEVGMRYRPGMDCSGGGEDGLVHSADGKGCSCGGTDFLMVFEEGTKKSVRSPRFLISGGMVGGEAALCSLWDVALGGSSRRRFI